MTLEIRDTGDPSHLKLYDGEDWIGEIKNVPLDEEGIALGDRPTGTSSCGARWEPARPGGRTASRSTR